MLKYNHDYYIIKPDNLNMDDDELNDYIYYTSLIKKKNAKILVGMRDIQARIDSTSWSWL